MDRLIEDEKSRKLAIKWIESQKLPFVLKVTEGRARSYEQNRLQFLWAGEIAAERGDVTAMEVQRELKLIFGTPILLHDNDEFARRWGPIASKLTWSEQLGAMEYLNVSSIMTTTQMKQYLDSINQFYTEQGFKLTQPDDMGLSSAAA